MAEKKREIAKTAASRAAQKADPIDYPAFYIRFRTALDSFEALALRHSLKDPNPQERMKRMKEIEEKVLMPFIKEYAKEYAKQSSKNLRRKNFASDDEPGRLPGECPDGFVNCGGCCVPYQCP